MTTVTYKRLDGLDQLGRTEVLLADCGSYWSKILQPETDELLIVETREMVRRDRIRFDLATGHTAGPRAMRTENELVALAMGARVLVGRPDMLVVDNGPELRGRDLDRWAHDHGVKLFFIDPGKPMQNGSIESFNGRFREECLDQSWFTSLAEARRVIEAWRVDYNLTRPHTSLRMATPAAFAAARPFAKRQRAPAPELCGGSPPEPVAALTPPVLSGNLRFP